MTQELIERLERELRRRSIGKPVTEYGRGWNCGLEEAGDIVRAEIQSQSARIAELREALREAQGYVVMADGLAPNADIEAMLAKIASLTKDSTSG